MMSSPVSPVFCGSRSRLVQGLLAAGLLSLVAACGGGGSSDTTDPGATPPATPGTPTTPVTPVAPSSYAFSGTAATGAAFAGAVVTVADASGQIVGTSDAVGADGKFTVTVPATARAPFVVVATRTAASGETEKLVSVSGALSDQTVNVTSVTTLIAARLSPSGNPSRLAAELAGGTATLTAEKIQEKAAEIQNLLAPLLAAAQVSGTNPLSDTFAADGAGYDRLLDSLLVRITPASDTTTNIEVAVRQQAASDGAAPISVQFNSSEPWKPLPSTEPYTLVEEGTAAKIAALLETLTACYALPIEQRISSPATNGVAVGGASAITASECRGAFVGNDPASFLNNGARVGRDSSNNGAFAGIFRSGSQGVKFHKGNYEYSRANGDIVISYKLVDPQNVETSESLVLRKDADGKLRAIGNQYVYTGGVAPFHQLRMFPTLNQSAYNYYSAGYTLNVINETEVVNGQPVLKFDRVEVDTPFSTTVTLWADQNYSNLNFKRADGRVSGTNFIRMGAAFVDPAAPVSSPDSGIERSMYFASPLLTDAQLYQSASQSSWAFKYFLRGNTGPTPDAVQTYRTLARAHNIAELKQKRFALLNEAFMQEAFSAGSDIPTTGPVAGALPMYSQEDGPQPAIIDVNGGGDAWTVPGNAAFPTTVTVNGSYAPQNTVQFSFNDSVRVASSARKATVFCTPPLTSGNGQCTDRTSGRYAPGSYLTGLQLSGAALDGRVFGTQYSTYRLNLPN